MELLIGSRVREHGNQVGTLAGFEFEPATRHIRRVVFSPDGTPGPNAMSCPLSAISLVHDSGDIELVPYSDSAELNAMPAVPDVLLLSRSTRLKSNGRDAGPLVGLDVDPAERDIRTVFGRTHWWSRRFGVPASAVTWSTPGEIRIASSAVRAA
jgi:hypothetical protein